MGSAYLSVTWINPAFAADAKQTNYILPVTVVSASPSVGYEVRERYVGRVVSRRASSLGFEHQGLLTEIRVDEGDRVKKGDILAQLDTTRHQARRRGILADLSLNEANRIETDARLALAKVTAKRRKKLLISDNVSQQHYDEASLDVEILQSTQKANDAAIEMARAAIAEVDVDIALSKIRAPFDGVIVDRLVDEGVALAAGKPVLRLIEDTVMEVRIGFPAKVAQQLTVAKVYDIEIEGHTYPGKLRTVLGVLDAETRTVPAIFEIENNTESGMLRFGQLARTEIKHTVQDEGFWLPIAALIGGRRGLWNAMAVEPNGEDENIYRVSHREVQVLYSEADRAYVRGAMKVGDLVISGGLHRVVPGQLVRLANATPKQ